MWGYPKKRPFLKKPSQHLESKELLHLSTGENTGENTGKPTVF